MLLALGCKGREVPEKGNEQASFGGEPDRKQEGMLQQPGGRWSPAGKLSRLWVAPAPPYSRNLKIKGRGLQANRSHYLI